MRRLRPPDVHVMPNRDSIRHVEAVQCVCRPAVLDPPFPEMPRLVVHHAADGREAFEVDGDCVPQVIH